MNFFIAHVLIALCLFSHGFLWSASDVHSPSAVEAPLNTHPASSTQSDEPVFPVEDLMEPPSNPQSDRFFVEFSKMLATLGLVIGLILIAAWFLKRLLNTKLEKINTSSFIKILEKRALSPKTALYLLEINNKKILIAETQNDVTRLAEFHEEFDETDSSSQEPSLPSSFKKILERKEYEDKQI